ncbi:hypothetical protein, partial [Profundibacter sp.]
LRIRHKTGDPVDGVASYLHTDQLGSVRVMTGADGASDKEVTYRPFGEAVEFVTDPAALPETKGFIRSRALAMPIPCHGNGRTLRRRRRPAISERAVL